MSRTFLILGRTGQVGWELCRTCAPLGRVVALDYPEVDFTNPDSLRKAVRDAAPDIIINAAAYTAVDKAETETSRAMEVNAGAPAVLAAEAKRTGALFVHYSTDYVYEGNKDSAYVETDPVNPQNAYGKTKLAGDQAVLASGCRHLIFRLCWVYGARGQNFMRTMMRLASERDQLKVVADQFGCPTWSRMIAEATTHAICRTLAESSPEKLYGVYHLASSGFTSWHGFAQAIIDLMPPATRKCSAVQPITTADYPLPARRPARSILDCSKLERTFGLRLPAWDFSLKQVVEP